MYRIITFILAAAALAAQPNIFSLSGQTSGKPGETVTVSVNLATEAEPAAFMFGLVKSTNLVISSVAAGAAAADAGKTIYVAPNKATVVGYSITDKTVASGEVAKVAVTLPLDAPSGATYSVSLTKPSLSSLAGKAIASSVAVEPLIISVVGARRPEDVNNDGKVDVLDITKALIQIAGVVGCEAIVDVDKADGCDIKDLQMIVNAIRAEQVAQ